MAYIGNPHQRFPAYHIAGTNGKGSVSHFVSNILCENGNYKVGLYTSPHLSHVNERIRVNGICIPDEELEHLLKAIRQKSNEWASSELSIEKDTPPLTYFELMTAVALCYFAEQRIDVAVVDATAFVQETARTAPMTRRCVRPLHHSYQLKPLPFAINFAST